MIFTCANIAQELVSTVLLFPQINVLSLRVKIPRNIFAFCYCYNQFFVENAVITRMDTYIVLVSCLNKCA